MQAAVKLFIRDGFENTSMSAVAAEAGINRPALHYYFRTKDRLYEEVFSRLVSSFVPRAEHILSENLPFFEKVDRIIDRYISVYATHPFLPRFIVSEVQRDPAHLVAVMRRLGYDRFLASLRRLLETETAGGRIRSVPVPVVAVTFFSQLTFPFLTGNLLRIMFGAEAEGFIDTWKASVKRQMRVLLNVDGSK